MKPKYPRFHYEADGAGGGGGGSLLSGAAPAGAPPAAAAPPPTPPPAGASWFKDDAGSFAPGWLDKLSPDLRGNASLSVVPSLEALAKSYVETKSLVGKKLEMPGEGATPEQLTAWRKTVGAPETPEGYLGDAKSLKPEAIPDDIWDAESEKKFLALAHKHHLSPGAVKEILGFYGESVAAGLGKSAELEKTMQADEMTKLRTAWGKDFDGQLDTAKRMALTAGLSPDNPIFTSAEVVQAFARFAKFIGEDRLVKGDNVGVAGGLEARIQDITDPKSQSQFAREYRGEFGPERQLSAQRQLHDLYAAREAAKKG